MRLYFWLRYRFFSRCWAQGCGRPMILHNAWHRWRCENTILGVVVVDDEAASQAA
jgi:hypothetical protein